jgi:hypothetical protein
MRINKSLITYQPSSGAGSGTVTSVALSAPTGFSVSGSPIVSSGTLALAFTTGYGIPPLMTGNSGKFLTTNGATMSWVNIAGTDVTGAAMTSSNDTNVQITLGGTPSTSLLRAVSLTLGWTGQLAVGRGGTGASTLTGVVIGNATSAMTAVAGTAGQFLRRNTANTAYEFRTLQGGDIAGSELTKTDDTNVTISLGGTPASALLQPVSLTMGWTGQLAVSRGGTGASSLTGVLIGNGTSAVTAVSGTAGQLLRRNAANTAYEFFTASLLTGNGTTNYIPKWVSSTQILDSIISETGNALDISASVASTLKIANFRNTSTSGFVSIGIDRSTSARYSFIEHSTAGTTDWYVGTAYNAGAANSVYSVGTGINLSDAKFNIFTTGQLKLNNYTSASSFSGLTIGYLGFTSTGVITTNGIPGGVSGTQDYLAKFDSTGVAVSNSRIVDNGTNFLFNSASSYVTGLNLIGDIGMQSASGQASAILMRSNNTPTSGFGINFIDAYAITTGTTYTRGGGIEFRASQNWNSTSAGTNMWVQTTPDNTTTPADMFAFLNNGAVRFIGRTSNPLSPSAGTMYYNSSANEMRYYNGTAWIAF